VAVFVAESYDVLPATGPSDDERPNTTDVTGCPNVAVTSDETGTPNTPGTGDTDTTDGGPATDGVNTTSTQ
jgi:hypothetical protein